MCGKVFNSLTSLNLHKKQAKHIKRDDSKYRKAPPRKKSKTLQFLKSRFSESSSSEDGSLDERDDDEGAAYEA